ncbi:hypothetical protein OKW11_000210 [Pseudomonas baetica]|nr:hypothetical protein [Pseudomonas baetica]
MRELELLGIKNIRMASQDLHGIILSSEAVAEDIWWRILDTVTRKGERSRRIYSADDKSYTRPELFEWFKLRVEDDQSKSGRKIYVKRDLPHILMPFRAPMATACAKRNGQVLHQEYFLQKYRYKHIVDNVCQWLDEVFLRPKEMADIHKLTLVEKRERLRTSVFKSLHDVREFLGRVLLHATIRQHHESQPIPCMLHVESPGAEKNCPPRSGRRSALDWLQRAGDGHRHRCAAAGDTGQVVRGHRRLFRFCAKQNPGRQGR